jgi:DNA-binding SARP family transcriptional activator/streptogramin lyase
MEFRLLGPLEVVSRDGSLLVGGGKRRSLLAILLLHPNEVVSAERLIDELWGERPPATAAKSVHVYVSQLRKVLRPDAAGAHGGLLITRSGGYELRVGPDDVDVARFERAVADAERAMGRGDAARAAGALRAALALWRGPALADFAYEQFAQGEIARLEELRLAALEECVEADLALGRHGQVVGELEALVRAHPLRERMRGQLMLALYRCGRQAAALEIYRDGRRRMVEEQGLEPGPALRELQEKILDQSADLNAPASADGTRAAPAPAEPSGAVRAVGVRRRWRPAAFVLGGGTVLLAASALAVLSEGGGVPGGRGRATLELAPNSVAGVDPRSGRPGFALPLPGRPTALRATGSTVWAATADSASLSGVDAHARSIIREVPLRWRPDAMAVGARAAWVANGSRGELVRITLGYADAAHPIRFRRGPPPRSSAQGTSVAAGGGSVWVTDGSRRLVRIDPATRAVTAIRVDRPLDAVTAGAGAVWAISASRASVLRIDPRTNAVTDRVALVARPGENAPLPTRIAASAGAVWVLSRNTATVTRIDPETRGVAAVIPIGIDRAPNEIAASDQAAWVANEDGTLSRIDDRATSADSLWVGAAVREIAVGAGRVWVATTALDQQLPGGG